ncbi:hypothetical protein Tco_0433972, partial [Tanacetum coccineum]
MDKSEEPKALVSVDSNELTTVIPAVDEVSTDGVGADGASIAVGVGADGASIAADVGADGVSVASSDATDAETQFALM